MQNHCIYGRNKEILLDIENLYPAKSSVKKLDSAAYREKVKGGNGYYKMKYGIVGRKKELKKLDEIFASREAEFLALYGRRRVGKPYWFDSNYHSGPGSKRVF